MSFYGKYRGMGGGGGGGGVTSLDGLTGALTLVAGTGISIVDGVSTITISSTSAGDVTIGAFGSTPNNNGLSINGSQVLNMQPADGTHPGGVSILTQSFAGSKTFLDNIIVNGTATVGSTTAGYNSNAIVGGSSGGIAVMGTSVGSIGVQGISTAGFGLDGSSTNAGSYGVYAHSSGGIGILATSASSHGIWGLGQASSALSIELLQQAGGGTQDFFQCQDSSNVVLARITAAGNISATNLSGTNTGDVTLAAVGSTPTADGASLSGQVLTLQPANASFPGVLTAADWTTFNNKQPAGSYATTTLNNLGSTAVNANIVPDSNAAWSLGTPSLNWGQVNTRAVVSDIGLDITATGSTRLSLNGAVVKLNAQASSDPVTPTPAAGDLYYNTVSNKPKFYNGGSWSTLGSGTVTSVDLTAPALFTVSGSPVTSSGTLALTYSGSALPTSNGGTGTTAVPTQYGIIYAQTTSQYASTNAGTAGQFLTSNGTSAPSWTTTLPIANGGTGQITKAAAFDALSPMTTGGDIIYGGASGTGTRLANGSAGQFLKSNGTTLAPSWAAVTAAPSYNYTAKTANYNAVAGDAVNCTSGSFTVTLPTAVGIAGQSISINNSSSGVITIATTSAQTIATIASGVIKMGTPTDSIVVTSDGANWMISEDNISVNAIYTGSTQTLTAGDVFNYSSSERDPLSLVTTGAGTPGTSAWRFTAPYQMMVTINAQTQAGNTVTDYALQIWKNGSQILQGMAQITHTTFYIATVQTSIYLVAGDYIQIVSNGSLAFNSSNNRVCIVRQR